MKNLRLLIPSKVTVGLRPMARGKVPKPLSLGFPRVPWWLPGTVIRTSDPTRIYVVGTHGEWRRAGFKRKERK